MDFENPHRFFPLIIQTGAAEYDNMIRGQNVKRGMRQGIKKGHFMAKPPKGYKRDKVFKEYLQTFQPTKEVIDLFTHVLDDIFNSNDADRLGRKKQVEAKIEDLKGRIENMDYKYADGGISDENYSRIITKLNNDLNELAMQHATFAKVSHDLNKYMNYSIGLLQNLSEYYASAAANTKHKLVGVIFPEKLIFKENWYYTTKTH